jgi:hypothetical protein
MSNDANRIRMFRLRAAEIRKIAMDIGDVSCRASLVQMAEYYEKLAAALQAKLKPDASAPKGH